MRRTKSQCLPPQTASPVIEKRFVSPSLSVEEITNGGNSIFKIEQKMRKRTFSLLHFMLLVQQIQSIRILILHFGKLIRGEEQVLRMEERWPRRNGFHFMNEDYPMVLQQRRRRRGS